MWKLCSSVFFYNNVGFKSAITDEVECAMYEVLTKLAGGWTEQLNKSYLALTSSILY